MSRHALLLPLLLLACPAPAQDGTGVRIYRCTDAGGTQSLRDTPCPRGQAQQARDMLRPRDAAAPAAMARRTPAPAASPAPAHVMMLAPPRPMYECVTPDGERYTSENGSGNPRWVPLWTLGEPYFGWPRRADAGRGSYRPAPSGNAAIGRPQQDASAMTRSAPVVAGGAWPAAIGGGTWISDACALLPPAEVCAILRDRRAAIRTRFFNAMPTERDLLRGEERAVNARLDNDCGGR